MDVYNTHDFNGFCFIFTIPFRSSGRPGFVMNVIPRHDIVTSSGSRETNGKGQALLKGSL